MAETQQIPTSGSPRKLCAIRTIGSGSMFRGLDGNSLLIRTYRLSDFFAFDGVLLSGMPDDAANTLEEVELSDTT